MRQVKTRAPFPPGGLSGMHITTKTSIRKTQVSKLGEAAPLRAFSFSSQQVLDE